jgi:hypothetical protein
MRRLLVLLVGLASACGGSPRDVADTPPAVESPTQSQSTTEVTPMKDIDFASWNNRCVIAEGYAVGMKIGEALDLGGPSIGVIFDGDGGWQVPLGAWVQVRGTIVERSDLPVFVQDPNEPIMQGMPVPEGTDLEQARKRWVIEHAVATLLRPLAQVEAELGKQVGQKVELRGILWSRNTFWWFVHDGVDMHIDLGKGVDVTQYHGLAVTLVGRLSRQARPRIDQIGLYEKPEEAEAFVITVDAIEPHPAAKLEACPTGGLEPNGAGRR